jgi:hypothetical protein
MNGTKNDESDLNEFITRLGLGDAKKEPGDKIESCKEVMSEPISNTTKDEKPIGGFCQWVVGPNCYSPTVKTIDTLPVGAYKATVDGYDRLTLHKMKIVTDELLKLPDTTSTRVLNAINVFWNAKEKFVTKGQLFKRGVMLWGPPGSGKTVTVMLLVEDLIKRGGIVLISQNPTITSKALEFIRVIEPDRPLICVMEDIDELIDNYGESGVLALLDGENQINNVVHIATTNYPERLDARIVNRPSRFDEIIKISMPSIEARRFYLRSRVTLEELNDEELEKWVIETNELSIAHLKELVIAIFCLGRTYGETIIRLKKMKTIPKSSDINTVGFGKGDP